MKTLLPLEATFSALMCLLTDDIKKNSILYKSCLAVIFTLFLSAKKTTNKEKENSEKKQQKSKKEKSKRKANAKHKTCH